MRRARNKWIPLLAAIAAFAPSPARGSEAPPEAAHPAPAWECSGVLLRGSGPSSARSGDVIHYRLRLSNEGDCALEKGTLNDYLPRNTVFVRGTPEPTSYPSRGGGTAEPSADPTPPPLPVARVQWADIGLRPEGNSAEYEISVQVSGPAGRVITNTACFEHPKVGRVCDTLDTYVRNVRNP